MKRFVLKTSLFFFLFGVTNLLYLYLLQYTDWDFKKRLEARSLSNPSFEMLIIGNSFAMDGFDAELITKRGITAYNLAISGASLRTNIIQLEEYLKTYPIKPKCVILGVGSYFNYFESDNIHPIVDFTLENKKYRITDLPLLKFKWLFKEVLKKIVSKSHRDAKLVLGQLRTMKTVPDTSKYNYSNKLPIADFFTNKYIASILQMCNSSNIKLFIVEMPGFKNVRHNKTESSLIIDTVSKNGIVIDLNTIEDAKVLVDNEDWIGNSHLNFMGAKKFTNLFLQKLNPYL
jgi:hypothetical protein